MSSKINIPTCTLADAECDTLFQSVVDKLNIQNPKFHYPIYDKIIDNAAEQRGLIFDSKFKVREILSKVLETDSDDYETDDDDAAVDAMLENDTSNYTFNLEGKSGSGSGSVNTESNTDALEEDNLDEVLNTDQDVDLTKEHNPEVLDNDDNDNIDSDREIDEAINNIMTVDALVERVNKATGEKSIKEEKIHIKKSPLLEPLKILKDEFLIPARLKNQLLADETLQRTRAKLDSYNNSAHVEALFLYLGNKLVESGKCPSFPYYYGCINGEDPNYHHDITDEYDMVSRTRWFRNRVKTDFDLLILEGDEMDEVQKEMMDQMHRPRSHRRFLDGESIDGSASSSGSDNNSDTSGNTSDDDKNLDAIMNVNEENDDFKAYKKYINKSLGLGLGQELDDPDADKDEDDDDDDDDEDIEKALEFLDKNGGMGGMVGMGGGSDSSGINETSKPVEDQNNLDKDKDKDKETNPENILSIDEIDSTLNNILEDIEDRSHAGGSSSVNINEFIKNIDDLNLDIQLDDQPDVNANANVDSQATQVVVNEDCLDDDLIEVLSDVDKENLTIDEFEDHSMNNQYYLKCAQIPVNLCMMEKLDQTLDDLLDDGYNMPEAEWFSIFFQVAFGLATAQKYFNFVHNDLHSSNVMFKATELKNLYFQIGSTYYRVPTFSRITKIIDFARGTFKLGDRWIFSDQFKEDGDAWGQYDYPSDGTLANCEHKPNPSFDLVRLGTTVIQRLDDVPSVREFVESITRDDYDNSLCYEEDTFQLYIDIAHNAHNAVPIEVLGRPEFERFRVAKERVPRGVYIFKY
jgi:hypothetical protein